MLKNVAQADEMDQAQQSQFTVDKSCITQSRIILVFFLTLLWQKSTANEWICAGPDSFFGAAHVNPSGLTFITFSECQEYQEAIN